MGAVFYLGAGWPQWKPLGIPGTTRQLVNFKVVKLHKKWSEYSAGIPAW